MFQSLLCLINVRTAVCNKFGKKINLGKTRSIKRYFLKENHRNFIALKKIMFYGIFQNTVSFDHFKYNGIRCMQFQLVHQLDSTGLSKTLNIEKESVFQSYSLIQIKIFANVQIF